jgi:protein SCO1/2
VTTGTSSLFSLSTVSSMVGSLICSAVVLAAVPAAAQMAGTPAAGYKREAALPASALPGVLREIGFDQNLDRQVPYDIPFADEQGHPVRLGDYFGTRPVVLAFVYYGCPLLCTQVLNALASALDVLSLQPGTDFEVVTISFDPREKPELAAAKKDLSLKRYQRAGAAGAWHFLTGDQPAIARATEAAGFRFVWDDGLKQFAHPTGIIVLTPDGRVARYLFGIEYGPRDLRLAIVDASAGKVGTPVDSFLLYCYHYDPMTGRYGLVIMRTIRVAGAATVLALGLFVAVMLRREHLARSIQHPAPSTQHPAFSTQHPALAPSTQHLHPAPSTGHPAPSTPAALRRGPR